MKSTLPSKARFKIEGEIKSLITTKLVLQKMLKILLKKKKKKKDRGT